MRDCQECAIANDNEEGIATVEYVYTSKMVYVAMWFQLLAVASAELSCSLHLPLGLMDHGTVIR